MAGSKRERELARAKYERQQERRAQQAAQRRRRYQVVTAVVVAVVVVAGVIGIQKVLGGSSSDAAAATTPTASSTTAATDTATPTTSAAAIPTDGSNATCSYPAAGTASKPVTAPATSAPTRPVTATAKLVLNGKTVTIQLLRSKAPCTVNSFVHLALAKYFANTPCHRLTSGDLSVLQCGDPSGSGSGGPGYSFADENLTGATYQAGTVAMANSGPNTNGSQFFVVYKDSPTLPPAYTPFGTVVGGMDVIDAIGAAGVKGGGTDGAPANPVTIDSVSIGG